MRIKKKTCGEFMRTKAVLLRTVWASVYFLFLPPPKKKLIFGFFIAKKKI
jgi:hypothetical protein